jgi:hypothetical protein
VRNIHHFDDSTVREKNKAAGAVVGSRNLGSAPGSYVSKMLGSSKSILILSRVPPVKGL